MFLGILCQISDELFPVFVEKKYFFQGDFF